MSKGILKIGTPFIKNHENKSELFVNVNDNGNIKKLSYTVENEFEKYLTYERSDAFVVALLYYAMINEYDIEWETPCSEQLIYQLKTYYIPICGKDVEYMNHINLTGPTTSEKLISESAAGTGFSGGVDSCYTVKKYIDYEKESYKLKYLVFTDWFISDFSDEYKEDFYKNYLERYSGYAEELGMKFVYVGFDIDYNFSVGRIKTKVCGEIHDGGLHTLKYCSVAMALQKMMSCYYFSSGFSPKEFSMNKDDVAYMDIFTLPLISTSDLMFYSSGMEERRIDKVKYISDWEFAKKHLQVCMWDNESNCGHCSKCIRTMSELYSLGKLDDFTESFPVQNYKDNISKRIAHVIMESKRGHVFEKDILKNMEKNNVKMPFKSHFIWPVYYVIETLRIKFRRMKFARKIYRKFHLDVLLHGHSTEKYSQSVDKEILGGNKQC